MKKRNRSKIRRERAIKRNNRKKAFIAAAALCVVAVTVFFAFNAKRQSESASHSAANQQNEARVFYSGRQTITLNADGTFAARLAHNNNKDGTYMEITEGNTTIVSFMYQGAIVNGRILNGSLTIPHEWDDGHGHGNSFRLR